MSPSLSLAALTVSELASKSFIQRACSSPMRPQSVLSFFYGVNYFDNEHEEVMTEGTQLLKRMSGLWYTPSVEYDQLCQAFVPVVRAAGKQELVSDEWNASVDGVMSQVVLCDQLSRNCFRGTEEAFQYDSVGLALTLRLVEELSMDDDNDENDNLEIEPQQQRPTSRLPGTMYPTYVSFLVIPLMHSEDVANHEIGLKVLEWSLKKFEGQPVCNVLDSGRSFLLGHKEILDRFGRYPHRNAKLGRTTTPKEQAWLDDKEHLPGWAKSQG